MANRFQVWALSSKEGAKQYCSKSRLGFPLISPRSDNTSGASELASGPKHASSRAASSNKRKRHLPVIATETCEKSRTALGEDGDFRIVREVVGVIHAVQQLVQRWKCEF